MPAMGLQSHAWCKRIIDPLTRWPANRPAQLAFGKDFQLNLRVTFGRPVTAAELDNGQSNLMPEIIKYGQTVLNTHYPK